MEIFTAVNSEEMITAQNTQTISTKNKEVVK